MWSEGEIKHKIDQVVENVVMLDKWADIEELTFPLENASEEEQVEWLNTFMEHLANFLRDELESEFIP